MKTSATLFFTDILPHKRNLFYKVVKNKIIAENDSADAVFPQFKKAGIDGIELLLPSYIKITDDDIDRLKEVLKRNKIPVLSLHQPLRFFTKTKISEIATICRIATKLKAKVVVLHIGNAGAEIFKKDYVEAIHKLQKEYSVVIGFENKEKYFASYLKKHTWHGDTFANLLEKNGFNITLDTQHLAQAGGDIITFFQKYKDRIVNIHLSDYRDNMWNTSLRPLRYKHMELGKGELKIREFLKVLRKEKYTGLITMEISTDLAGICASAQVINTVIK